MSVFANLTQQEPKRWKSLDALYVSLICQPIHDVPEGHCVFCTEPAGYNPYKYYDKGLVCRTCINNTLQHHRAGLCPEGHQTHYGKCDWCGKHK